MTNELMLPLKPFLLPAFYHWIVNSKKTPYFLVDATQPRVAVPEDYVRDGEIVLNASPNAIRELSMTAEALSFQATFSGEIFHIYVPSEAILSIYAAENGRGMLFEEEGEVLEDDKGGDGGGPAGASHLRAVK